MKQDLRIAKGNETKDLIAAASMKIISEEGLEGLSAKKIAVQSGVSKSTVFHHFKTVDEVSVTVFEKLLSAGVEPVKTHSGPDLDAFLRFLGESIYSLSEKERLTYSVLLHFYNASLHNPEHKRRLLKSKEEMITAVVKQLSRYSTQQKETLVRVSEMILMTMDGYGLHFLLEAENAAIKEIWKLQIKAWKSLLA